MHPRTIATLDELENITWFTRVGVRDTAAAIVLSSWREAIDHCSSQDWEDLCLEAANQYSERLLERSKEQFQKWNQVAEETGRLIEPLVDRKIAKVVSEESLPNVFRDTVTWTLGHLAIESEFADVYPPGFFASQAYWYVKGHFPCGWQGEFPDGKLIIY
jgi:hypothetical protein